ncbi:hypothetical protein AGMMS49982_10420 [Bacteroidia bacterium]|nr:hypothetical protein AGMMS49982_10420 [Bacteroidia bacterium]
MGSFAQKEESGSGSAVAAQLEAIAADSLSWVYSIEENEDDGTTKTKAKFTNNFPADIEVALAIELTYIYASEYADTLSLASTNVELVTNNEQFATKELLGGITVMFDKNLQSYSYRLDTDEEGFHHISLKNYRQFLSQLPTANLITIACSFVDESNLILKYAPEGFTMEALLLQTEEIEEEGEEGEEGEPEEGVEFDTE